MLFVNLHTPFLMRFLLPSLLNRDSQRLKVSNTDLGNGQAEQLLRYAGDGNPAALSQTYALVSMLHADAALAHQLTPKPIPRPRPPRPAPYPGAQKVLDIRPLPKEQLTGRRHVPHIRFINAERTAFLMFKKPQSPYLSRVLKQVNKARIGRLQFLEDVEEDIQVARLEAEWETLVEEAAKAEGQDPQVVRKGDKEWGASEAWTRDLARERRAVQRRLSASHVKAGEIAVRMMDIKDEEERLLREEKKEEKHKKNEERKARKRERELRKNDS
ncbi:uncharacterized protein BP5553_01792 [Venustampulla echinocandica]|uniref:Uncharacterized protein n=1 Tax=Venustampulla echinocandica TaxID=2656787 RepID=A0A370U242_9HELO|nr:uncharacterized protein BP5553_01792 [Venustampulla echinocandica]RDL41813.1 hypothetical protein BP5553_01792 [Venustampulla echinocandica]